jgi:hypothetical protein
MKKNVGGADKVIRILVGLALLSLLFILESNARWWGLVGLPLLMTGITGYCPGYMPFGISTSKTK